MKITPLNDKKLIHFVMEISGGLEGYLVGGCVRDWYLGKRCYDLDFTFNKYPIQIAHQLAEVFKLDLEEFKKFLTIRLRSSRKRIDLATFRREIYLKPAALPLVETASSIEEDLKRRDFTMNAIAISLNELKTFEVVDPLKGIDDIKAKIIRVIHKKSFIDDPTRIFRAIRFSERFNWKIEKGTMKLMEEAIGYVKHLSPERIKNEIIKILSEEKCYSALKKILDLKILSKEELFEFDHEIDSLKDLNQRYIYIAKRNRSLSFFERYGFERKLKRFLKSKIEEV